MSYGAQRDFRNETSKRGGYRLHRSGWFYVFQNNSAVYRLTRDTAEERSLLPYYVVKMESDVTDGLVKLR